MGSYSKDKDVIVKFNGQEIEMLPFVEELVRNTITGLMASLKGYEEGADISIEIKD